MLIRQSFPLDKSLLIKPALALRRLDSERVERSISKIDQRKVCYLLVLART